MPKYVHTITTDDIKHGMRGLALGGELGHGIRACMGRLLPLDVGKRVYRMAGGIYQVENNEQRDARLAKG